MNWAKTLRVSSVFVVIFIAIILSFPLNEKIKLGLDLQGGSHVILECIDTPNAPVDNDAVNRVLEIIRNRILVQLPGVADPDAAVDLIGKTALLEFKSEEGETQLTGAHLIDAKSSFDQFSRSTVLIEFDKIGAKEFGEATKKSVGKVLAITLDGKEISAPVVQEPILDGKAQITGKFTVESANHLALLLRSGSLPVKVEILENRSIGPTLGRDSISKGIKAGIIGLILILLFMLIWLGTN